MNRKIVIVNQAANYLTVGLANAFHQEFPDLTLMVGSLHCQGEALNQGIKIHKINPWQERPSWKKALSYLIAMARIWTLLWTKYRHHEVLFISAPPMGYLLNLFVINRFSMVIWDLYPDTFKITGMKESNWLYRLWGWMNRHSFRKAFRLFTISDVMADAMSGYVERERIIIHPIWSIFEDNQRIPERENRFITAHNLHGRFIVQYSGNIGLTHNVEILIDIAEKLQQRPDILFQIIGRGPRRPHIERLVMEKKLKNVQFLPFQSDDMFPHSLSAANLGVVMLDSKVSRGSVPSKAYNLMSFGIPSLYVSAPDSQLALYAKRFQHAQCFTAEQIDQIVCFISMLAEDSALQRKMSLSAEMAASHFRPANAQSFVESYISLVPNASDPGNQKLNN
jgi:glycosyltransferase involved in cell wall biosynthesis